MSIVRKFVDIRDAKEFLISRITTEAMRENVPLSEIERKMLYFSETAWTLPDIAEVSSAFDRDYNQPEYEKKIGALVRRNFCSDTRKTNRGDLDEWKEAVRTIRQEDHYLFVLIAATEGSTSSPKIGFLKLLTIGFAITCVLFVVAYLLLVR